MTIHAKRPLATRPNIEQYKKQARELLNQLQSGQPDAVDRLRAAAPYVNIHAAGLADAQFTIAREHGFMSWPKFKRHIETSNAGLAEKAVAFVRAATSDRLSDAKALLAETPGLAQSNLYTALTYGDVDTVARFLNIAPQLLNTAGGPRDRQPILYCCFSRFIFEREDAIADTVRLLLDRGADPNATYLEGQWPLPALYGACGQLNNARLAAMLIDAGANVNDDESLYHSVEHRNHVCTRLLLERGARPNGTNTLKHQLDIEDFEGLKLLLDYGADPNDLNQNGENALHWAIYRRRSVACVELLIDHGVDVNAARNDGMTPYRMIWQIGGGEIEDLLRKCGAQPILAPEDELIAAAGRGDQGTVRKILTSYPDTMETLNSTAKSAVSWFAGDGNTTAVAVLLDAGFPIDSRGEMNATPLHLAAWQGRVDTVKLLIDRGAPLEIEGADLGSTPLQWAIHASANNPDISPENAIATVDLLMQAGAIPRTLEMASDEVRTHIEEKLK